MFKESTINMVMAESGNDIIEFNSEVNLEKNGYHREEYVMNEQYKGMCTREVLKII